MALLQAKVLKGEDSVNAAAELPGLDVYCFYTDGRFANGTATKQRFPGKKYVGITPFNADFADCQDIETGDATPADFPAFVRNSKHPNIDKPMAYASLNVMPEVIKAAQDAGIPRSAYYLFVAEWTGVGHIPAGYDATQYASNSGFDSDLFYDYVFGTPVPSPPPVKQTVAQIEYYKNGFGWVYETPVKTQPTDPGKILLPYSNKIRVRATNGRWSNWVEITPE